MKLQIINCILILKELLKNHLYIKIKQIIRPMRKNTLFHHKKSLSKSRNSAIQKQQPSQLILQNPQNSAKFCLLEISEQNSKSGMGSRVGSSFQNHHFRSFSTEFFNNKKIDNDGNIAKGQTSPQISNNIDFTCEVNSKNSVAQKSTFSNQMRKTMGSKLYSNGSSLIKQQRKASSRQFQSRQNFRKTNYFPLTVYEQKSVQRIGEIFRSAPSKQIIAILRKTKFARDLSECDKFSKEKQEGMLISGRKRSIFNIRHLMVKQKLDFETVAKSSIKKLPNFSTKRLSCESIPQVQMHSTNKSVVKLRLKNRCKQSAMSNI